ncbi:MAG: fibronectin type III domain-containing protein [Anderseniella sp.]
MPESEPEPTVPGTMAAPTLEVGNGELIATWTAPDDGGSPIIGYELQYRTGDEAWTEISSGIGTNTSHTITGLANAAEYHVQARAVNAIGAGDWSESAAETPPPTVPDAPDAPTLEAGNTQLTANWTPPEDNGSAITAYELRHSDDGGSSWSEIIEIPAPRTGTAITDLENDTEYVVQVRARNSAGAGEWSGSSEGATPISTVPTAPNNFMLTADDAQITATWTAPTDPSVTGIADYELQYREIGAVQWEDAVSIAVNADPNHTYTHLITSLTNGSEYEVQVYAVGTVMDGDMDRRIGNSATDTATPIGPPAALTAPTLTSGSTQLTATWTAPNDGGSPITAYHVQHRISAAGVWSTTDTDNIAAINNAAAMSYTIPNLTNGTSYQVRVRAANAQGDGGWSSPAIATPVAVPDTMNVPMLTIGDNNLTVTWTAPNDGGSTITEYNLRHSADSGSSWSDIIDVAAPAASHIITNLTNGTTYDVQVRAVNALGDGAWSISATATPVVVPDKMDVPTLTPGNSRLTATWTAPDDGGSAITEYNLRHSADGGSSWSNIIDVAAQATSHIIADLTNGQSYDVQMRAVNALGDGEWSNSSTASPPLFPNERKILASDKAANDKFGIRVAVDGDTAIVGAYRDDDNGSDSGSAYVFIRDNSGNWSQQVKLKASDGAANDSFGHSVALSGNTVIVGAYNDDDNGSNSGSAYVFIRDNSGNWSQQAKLTASDGAANDYFGYTVAVDGNTAIVGAHQNNDNGTNSGSAYVFIRNGSSWSQQANLKASGGAANDNFGHNVAVDGDTAIVGAHNNDDNGNNSGSAYVFIRNGSSWSQQVKLLPLKADGTSDGTASDYFGHSVAVDGDTAIVGAHNNDDNGNNSGSAYVFIRNGSSWSQQVKLLPLKVDGTSDGDFNDRFGNSVAVDGNTVIVGALQDAVGTNSNAGSAYVFTRNGTSWTQYVKLEASDESAGDRFGSSVAVDGDTAIIGARADTTNSGSAYIFSQ